MPATYSQDGGGGDWNAAASWTGGAAPGAGDDVGMLAGVIDFVTNLPTLGVDYGSLRVGRQFAGSIGAPGGNVLQVGSIPKIIFEGERCRRAYIEVDTGETVTDFFVEATSENADGLVITRNGTGVITRLRIRGGHNIVLAGTGQATRFIMESIARMMRARLESGASVATAMIGAGIVDCYTAITSELHLAGGVWNHFGQTLFDIPTVIVARGATLNFWSGGGTLTNVYNFGTINCNGGQGKARAITNYYDCGGIIDRRGLGNSVLITNRFMSGGQILEAA